MSKVKAGDIIVAEDNFGTGSAREQAAMTLKYAGISAVVADSLNWAFYWNAINNGLPIIAVKGISKEVSEGNTMEVDLEQGIVRNITTGKEWKLQPVPKIILDILSVGGAIPYYKKR